MGCGGSKTSQQSEQNRREAERWQRRKKTGFRDSGLERHRQACVDEKKKLHHVEDPEERKKQKGAKMKTNQAEGKKKVDPTGPMGLTESELQKKRAGLKHR